MVSSMKRRIYKVFKFFFIFIFFILENQRYKIKKSENLKILDSKPGVYTQYKPFLQKDKTILKKLFRGIQTKRPGEVQTALLKRHLIELTESFMIPLERYIASLMPLQKDISPFKVTVILSAIHFFEQIEL